MAGGVGSRFWPVSRNATPKQFLDILGTGRSFLQATVDRFKALIPAENIFIVTSKLYETLVAEQVPEVPKANVLLESRKKNTAPCIAYATYKIYKKNPEATVVVSPADHLVLNENVFIETVKTLLDYAAGREELFTIGIKPTRPETQYGYIQANRAVHNVVNGHTAYEVKTFTEKPNLEMAKVLVKSGEFLWNSGIFVWSLAAIKKELESHLPDIAHSFNEISDFYYTDKEQRKVDEIYDVCQSISIDYAVMEKAKSIWVFEASFGWSDLGTWESLYAYGKKDANGNLVGSEASLIEASRNNIIVSNEKGKLIMAKGLDNYMIISTKDVLLICPRDEKGFKGLLAELAINNLTKYQ